MKKAIFLDKDGTLIENVAYNVNTKHISLLSGVVQTLKELQSEGYLLVVITNQSGIAKGKFNEDALRHVAEYMKQLLSLWKIQLDGFYYCPHETNSILKEYDVDCECKKPKPGLLLQAAFDHDIDLNNSWMVGDLITDVEAGKRAGCRTILFSKEKEFVYLNEASTIPDALATHWNQIGDIILGEGVQQTYAELI